MRAVSSVQPISFEPPRSVNRDDALAMLGEIVAQLAERVELLETREQIGRATFVRRKAGTVKARE